MTPADRQRQLADATGTDGARRGRDYCRALAAITDEWVADVFAAARAEHPSDVRLALVAVGGYGRGELSPFSDLDLLLIHDAKPRKVRALVEPTASATWYPVWDAGVKLGHAVRTIDEQVALARDDLDTATAMLTARPLAGDDVLADELIEATLALWNDRREAHFGELHRRVVDRKESAGDVAYRLDPDLKDGHGGLRDVQSLWWAAAGGLNIPAADLVDLDLCYDTLLRARVALHLATGRSTDVLRLEEQDGTAAAGGWTDADALMADVAAAGRTIAWLVDENWGRAVPDADAGPNRLVAPGIILHGGEIQLTDGADPATDPTLVLSAGVAAARHRCRIGRESLERLRDDTAPWPDTWPVGATDELVALLLEGHRAIPVLEALDQRELIERLLPEWGPVRSKPQRNAYHRFTVDRHLWEAAANAADLVDRVRRPDLLVLAALFHDLGKGYPGDHTEVGVGLIRRIAPRLGFGPADVDVMASLVEHHLLLADVAMRRDLHDQVTIQHVADAVGSVEVLDLLHALTEADSQATGPSAWGTWKGELIDDLVARVRHVLGGGDVAEVTWRLFPDADTLALMAEGEVDIARRDDLVTVVSTDVAGTFSRVAGVLSLHGLDVVSAQAHSDEQGMAASQFRIVVPAAGIDWPSIESDLHRALARELAIEARLAERARTYRRRRSTQARQPGPPSVRFIEGASSNATVIEVHAATKIGILHRITKALSELGLDIRHATVQTIGMEVVDTFYVRTPSGGLVVDPHHRDEIVKAVLHAVG